MKIALVQQSCSDNINQNRQGGIEAVKKAAEQGAKIICFAELSFRPFYPQIPASGDIKNLAEPIPGPTTDKFCELAKDLGVVIVLQIVCTKIELLVPIFLFILF